MVGSGVYYGAAPGEAEEYRGASVAVVGGANSAGQAALHFAGTAAQVTMLIRGDSISRGMSQYLVERVEANQRIDVRTNTHLVRASGSPHLSAIEVSGPTGEETIGVDGPFS